MELKFTITVKDKYGNLIDVDVIDYEGKLVIELDIYNEDCNPTFEVSEVDKLIRSLQKAKEVISGGMDSDR